MRASTRRRPSSEGEDNDLEKFCVKPSLRDGDGPPPSKKKKNKDVPAQENLKAKGRREEPLQASSFFSKQKRSKKRQRKSGIDLEELLAQTYHKEISAPVESAKKTPAGGSDRRSNRKKTTPAKRVSDSAKKWSGDEEIFLSKALLECRSPVGKINKLAFYQQAKESLHDEVSNFQLYDKMRSMKKRFKAIQTKIKEHNVAEDEFRYKTHHQSTLFKIWKQIWGNNGDSHGNHSENLKENCVQDLSEFVDARENVVETPKEIENENPRGNGRQIRNENSMAIEGGNPGEYEAEAPRERGAESPIVIDNETENSGEAEGENPRGIEGENSGDVGSESPIKNEVTEPRGSGVEKGKEGEGQKLQNSVSREKEGEEQNLQNSVSREKERQEQNLQNSVSREKEREEQNLQNSVSREKEREEQNLQNSVSREKEREEQNLQNSVSSEKEGEEQNLQNSVFRENEGEEQNLQNSVSREKEGEEQNLQKSVSHETQNIEDNRVNKLLQSGRFEDNIKILLEKTESRLQASIESSINRVAVASAAGAKFQPFGGFGPEMGIEILLSRRMQELMDGLNSVKGLPGLDSVEARELQQKWHALKIQEVRMFCESLDLLQKQCRLLLKNAESSSSTDNHGS